MQERQGFDMQEYQRLGIQEYQQFGIQEYQPIDMPARQSQLAVPLRTQSSVQSRNRIGSRREQTCELGEVHPSTMPSGRSK